MLFVGKGIQIILLLFYFFITFLALIINTFMTWSRLFHIKSLQLAMQRVVPNLPLPELHVSKRYQAQIRKQFRLHGIPWVYDLDYPKQNPRDKKPKTKKRVLLRE